MSKEEITALYEILDDYSGDHDMKSLLLKKLSIMVKMNNCSEEYNATMMEYQKELSELSNGGEKDE